MLLFAEGASIAPEDVRFDEDPMTASNGAEPGAADPTPRRWPAPDDNLTLARTVRLHIRRVCESVNGNQRKAAVRLGISRARLSRHLHKVEQRSRELRDLEVNL